MMERRQIVEMSRRGESGVLVTLVHTEGSSYRRPGARLLTGAIAPAAAGLAYAGTISGGCLETEVVKKADWKVRRGPVVERYSTLFDDTAEIPYGLGCGGTVDLLFEATGTPEADSLLQALEASLEGASFTVITWLPGDETRFARAVLNPDGSTLFASAGVAASDIAAALLTDSTPLVGDGPGLVFVEHLKPPQRLVVFGAGDDAKPLVSMAALLGWSVIVVDGRAQLARPERFPEAQRVIAAHASEAASLRLRASDAVVLMTHSYEQDREWLAAVLPIAPRYFGVLGAKHRSSLLVSEAAVMTGLPLTTCCERIYAPVGLDLGGDGPEAIALAVIAEAQARCMGRLGNSLRLSAADVFAQVERGGASRYLQAQCALDIDTDAAG
jgi:xanthine/CO dehydrogenase XdhC/CoxF family maturation factor